VTVPSTLVDIRKKVRRITGRTSDSQITDAEIDSYINTFYIYDLPEHLRLESLRVNYQFVTTANRSVYDFPTNYYLTAMPPVFIGGYQSYMTQSRENFFRTNPQLNYMQASIATGAGVVGPYAGTLINSPIMPGFKRNPPGAYTGLLTDCLTKDINWNVLITAKGAPGTDGISPWYSLVDDGFGNLVSLDDTSIGGSYTVQGTINYITGVIAITNFVNNLLVPVVIPVGNPINAQYIPYVASRPQSCVFYQDQIILYPVPDQAYTVSFEAYIYPTALLDTPGNQPSPQLREWWQVLAYGAADKIFADNADMDNMAKFRPLLEEQLRLILRRTLQQYAGERTATIYTEQSGMGQYPFGNLFSGF
jgi:hypothetical protein